MSAGKLVTKNGGQVVEIGAIVTTSDGEEYEVMGWRRPHKPSSSGRIHVKPVGAENFDERSYFPHVFDLEIVDYD